MQAFRDGYVARKSPNPNNQARALISKRLFKITTALKFDTNRKISLKSFGIIMVYAEFMKLMVISSKSQWKWGTRVLILHSTIYDFNQTK